MAGELINKRLEAYVRKCIELLYSHNCTVWETTYHKDPDTGKQIKHELPIIINEPCRLSHVSQETSEVHPLPTGDQTIKLFIAPDCDIPPGSKIVVEQEYKTETYTHSGQVKMFFSHQEIELELWDNRI